MSREHIEVEIEPVTGKERETVRNQELSQGMNEQVCCMLSAGPQLERWYNLGARINRQPYPEHLGRAAEPGANFVQLQVWEMEVTEAVLMKELSVSSCAREPPRDGGLTGAEDPLCGGRIESFSQRREDHGDLMGRGFQTVQGGVSSGREGSVTRLTAERLDPLGLAMLAIAHQRMLGSIGDAKVAARSVGTSETISGYAFGGSPPAFDLAPGLHRSRRWLSRRRDRGGQTTDRAVVWATRLQETVERAALGRAF